MKNYIQNLISDKKELAKIVGIFVLSFIFLKFFSSSYSNTNDYDMPAEFAGYLMLFSVLLFLYISFTAKNAFHRNLSLIQLLLAITSFLILKIFILLTYKMVAFYITIFLFLFLLKEIADMKVK